VFRSEARGMMIRHVILVVGGFMLALIGPRLLRLLAGK